MDKAEQREFAKLEQRLRRVEKAYTLMMRRVDKLEKQQRSIKAKAHQSGINVDNLSTSLSRALK